METPAGSSRILVLFAHPAFQKSRVNRMLLAAIRGLAGITLHDLYERYPDLLIDVGAEQALLAEHDLIVFHHPFYWYSTPALLKEWQDLVLEHGYAYGAGGTALRGKRLLSAITTGGRGESYSAQGINRYTIRELLRPVERTAALCGMAYLPPFVVHGTHRLTEPAHVQPYAEAYRELLLALRDGRLPEAALAGATYLNDCAGALGPAEG